MSDTAVATAPMTTTVASATSAETDATTPAVLGLGMTHRARSQSVLARHWSAVGVVGAVGRASVGFGLAVGRSRSIRPTVRFDDLNSAALRPSFDVARRHRGLDDEPDVDAGVDASAVSSSAVPARTTPTPARRPATLGAPTGVAQRQPDRARRHPRRPARPTWTDQIIQRSSIGFVAPAPGSPMPTAAAPADFVPSGDARLDQLRLLVREREGADGPTPAAPATAPVAQRRPVGTAGDATVLRRTTAEQPTIAAPAPGPGRLARAMRPEFAVAPSVPSARLGELPTPGASRSTGSNAASAASRTRRGAPATAQPSRLDQLRAALVEQGILPAGGDSDDISADVGTDTGARAAREVTRAERPSPTGAAEPETPRRASTTTADLRRSISRPTSPLRRVDAPGSSPDPAVTPTSYDASARRTPTPGNGDPAPTSSAGTTALVDSANTTAPTGTGPAQIRSFEASAADEREHSPAVRRSDAAPLGAAALAPVAPPLAPRDAATLAPVAPPLAPRDAATPTASQPTPAGALALAERAPLQSNDTPARALRAQRLLRSGLVSDRLDVDRSTQRRVDGPAPEADAGVVESRSVDPGARTAESTIDAVRTSASIEAVVAPLLPGRFAPDRPTEGDRVTPSLAGIESSPDTVIRRVTLPRALSTVHRPAMRVTAADVSTVTGAPSTLPVVQRASAIRLAEVGAGTVADPAGASAGPVSRPLLHVVRRLGAEPHEDHGTTLPSSAAPVEGREAARMSPVRRSTSTPAGTSASADDTARGESAQRPAAERVADQFMSVLSETMRSRPTPLPTTYRPLADAIAGPRPVMLSTDTASRKALRAVGKVAATTGDTIHLDRGAISASRLDEVMAHELTHVAHPSPAPRFFDDIDDSPEERRAEQVAKLMARSPLAPSASTSAPSIRRRTDGATIRRSPASTSSSSGTVSANSLAASLTRTTAAENTVQRWDRATPSGQRPKIGSHRPATTAPTTPTTTSTTAPTAETTETPAPAATPSDEWFRTQLDANLDRVVRMLEDRMIVELERRGGRAWRHS